MRKSPPIHHSFLLSCKSSSSAIKFSHRTIPTNTTAEKLHHSLLQVRLLLRRRTTTRTNIDSYALLRALRTRTHTEGIQTHQLVITLGFQPLVFLQTALLTMYSQSGRMTDAHRVFDEMPHRTLVSWTALISAYVNNQRPNIALQLFRQMQLESVDPDLVTLTVALSASADLGALDAGEWIHTYVRKQGFRHDLILTNALINMYCKCGEVAKARQLFLMAQQRDATTWTSIVVGLALHGRASEALEMFEEMKKSDCRPNDVTFVGVLAACSHAGLVEEGKRQWEEMKRCYNVKPTMAHYGCMVDLLCRAGQLEEAYDFIQMMPVVANSVVWRTLLGACGLKGNVAIANCARKRLLELEPDSVSDRVSMSNVYAKAGLWEEKESTRMIKGRRAPGCSFIEVGSHVHEFVAGDKRQTKMKEIEQVLEGIVHCSKDMECGQLGN